MELETQAAFESLMVLIGQVYDLIYLQTALNYIGDRDAESLLNQMKKMHGDGMVGHPMFKERNEDGQSR